MSILNGVRGRRRIRIDITRLADELARHVPDLAPAEAGPVVHDRTAAVRPALALVRTKAGTRAAIARLERGLAETGRGRNTRTDVPVRVRLPSPSLVLGAVVVVLAAVVVVILLDPARGRERRATIGRRMRGLLPDRPAPGSGPESGTEGQDGAAPTAGTPAPLAAPTAAPIAAPAWPAEEGPIEQPLHDPAFGAHEALPEALVSTAAAGDPAGAGPLDAGPHA